VTLIFKCKATVVLTSRIVQFVVNPLHKAARAGSYCQTQPQNFILRGFVPSFVPSFQRYF